MEGLVILGIILGLAFIGWFLDLLNRANKYDKLKPQLDELDGYKTRLIEIGEKFRNERIRWEFEFEKRRKDWEEKVEFDKEMINKLAQEKSKGFPWLANAYADYFHLEDLKTSRYLKHKKHPAKRAAAEVRKNALMRRKAEKLYRILKYQMEYYENLFPWLVDFKSEDIDDLIIQIFADKDLGSDYEANKIDPAKKWLTAAEYKNLPRIGKYQLALDRYWNKKKSKWEIGRDYERYIGYCYEKKGFSVYYQGIIEGLSDLGRDLIITKGKNAEIVQCKNWSQEKQIHEKHIFQLFGTAVAYKIDNPKINVLSRFVTSTKLSDRAKQFANELHLKFTESFPFKPYPCVKCNISRKDGTKIYHLPFDQQYDKTLIEQERNECYVWTVKEAEELGFRRAFKWRGEHAK